MIVVLEKSFPGCVDNSHVFGGDCCVKVVGGKLPRTKLIHFVVVTIRHLIFFENGGKAGFGKGSASLRAPPFKSF